MKRRALFALVVLMATLGAYSTPACAAGPVDYSGVCNLSLSVSTAPITASTVLVSGVNFPANTNQPILLDGVVNIGVAVIGPTGSFSVMVNIPAGLPVGLHFIAVFCVTSGLNAVSNLDILGISFLHSIIVTPPVVVRGNVFHTRSTGWTPGAVIHHVLSSTPVVMGDATADSNGVANIDYRTVSSTELGADTVTATGQGADGNPLTQQAPVTVIIASTPFARTGSNSQSQAVVGLSFIGLGGALLAASRRRRRHAAVA